MLQADRPAYGEGLLILPASETLATQPMMGPNIHQSAAQLPDRDPEPTLLVTPHAPLEVANVIGQAIGLHMHAVQLLTQEAQHFGVGVLESSLIAVSSRGTAHS
jgi:hypothetical protein